MAPPVGLAVLAAVGAIGIGIFVIHQHKDQIQDFIEYHRDRIRDHARDQDNDRDHVELNEYDKHEKQGQSSSSSPPPKLTSRPNSQTSSDGDTYINHNSGHDNKQEVKGKEEKQQVEKVKVEYEEQQHVLGESEYSEIGTSTSIDLHNSEAKSRFNQQINLINLEDSTGSIVQDNDNNAGDAESEASIREDTSQEDGVEELTRSMSSHGSISLIDGRSDDGYNVSDVTASSFDIVSSGANDSDNVEEDLNFQSPAVESDTDHSYWSEIASDDELLNDLEPNQQQQQYHQYQYQHQHQQYGFSQGRQV